MEMHEPTRVVAPRPNGQHFVVCEACALRGRGRHLRIGEQDYSGVLYGPVSEELAESLIHAHREASVHTDARRRDGSGH
jgi:hypothetical protein